MEGGCAGAAAAALGVFFGPAYGCPVPIFILGLMAGLLVAPPLELWLELGRRLWWRRRPPTSERTVAGQRQTCRYRPSGRGRKGARRCTKLGKASTLARRGRADSLGWRSWRGRVPAESLRFMSGLHSHQFYLMTAWWPPSASRYRCARRAPRTAEFVRAPATAQCDMQPQLSWLHAPASATASVPMQCFRRLEGNRPSAGCWLRRRVGGCSRRAEHAAALQPHWSRTCGDLDDPHSSTPSPTLDKDLPITGPVDHEVSTAAACFKNLGVQDPPLSTTLERRAGSRAKSAELVRALQPHWSKTRDDLGSPESSMILPTLYEDLAITGVADYKLPTAAVNFEDSGIRDPQTPTSPGRQGENRAKGAEHVRDLQPLWTKMPGDLHERELDLPLPTSNEDLTIDMPAADDYPEYSEVQGRSDCGEPTVDVQPHWSKVINEVGNSPSSISLPTFEEDLAFANCLLTCLQGVEDQEMLDPSMSTALTNQAGRFTERAEPLVALQRGLIRVRGDLDDPQSGLLLPTFEDELARVKTSNLDSPGAGAYIEHLAVQVPAAPNSSSSRCNEELVLPSLPREADLVTGIQSCGSFRSVGITRSNSLPDLAAIPDISDGGFGAFSPQTCRSMRTQCSTCPLFFSLPLPRCSGGAPVLAEVSDQSAELSDRPSLSSESAFVPRPSFGGGHLRVRSMPMGGAFGDTPPLSLRSLLPVQHALPGAAALSSRPTLPAREPASEASPVPSGDKVASEADSSCAHSIVAVAAESHVEDGIRTLVDAFFAIAEASAPNATERADADSATVVSRWPASLAGSRLERVLVRDGFCPPPETFYAPDPQGFGGEPFVFSLLETALDPRADPGGMLYGCVCGDGVVGSDEGGQPGRGRTVLCLVSKTPLFDLHFEVLRLLRAGDADASDDRSCSGIGAWPATFLDGLARGHLASPLQFPSLSIPPAFGQATLAQRQAAWGLRELFQRWDTLAGDHLVRLLACVLLEQSLIMLGDAPRVSTVALILRSLLWPFRWLHLFLSAPPPARCLNIPLHDAPFPMILAFTRLPPQWAKPDHGRMAVKTVKDLPPEIVAVELRHAHIEISDELRTSGGLRGADVKFPGGRHLACRKSLNAIRRRFRAGEIDAASAAEDTTSALSGEVKQLADLVSSYARAQVTRAVDEQDLEATSDAAGQSRRPTPTAKGSRLTTGDRVRHVCTHQAGEIRADDGGAFPYCVVFDDTGSASEWLPETAVIAEADVEPPEIVEARLDDLLRELNGEDSAAGSDEESTASQATCSVSGANVVQAPEPLVDADDDLRTRRRSLRERCWRRAASLDEFVRWLAAERPEAMVEPDVGFYKTFFNTQLCLDFLEREIVSMTSLN